MTVLVGDCREVMRTMADNTVDAIVTDPPYELGFMGKSWDSTGVAYDVTVWQECLRVLKPGGHLLAFGGSRTYHRLAVAIEDAGFQIRDQIMWVYGSGFPKSLNISKAIDKAAGAEREVVGTGQSGTTAIWSPDGGMGAFDITAPATDAAKQWEGWGTALKPAHEPIVMARKPLDGTVANNVLTHGVGGLNIDGNRVGRADGDDSSAGNRTASGGDGSGGWSQNEQGRFPANFIHDGSDEVLELFPNTKSIRSMRGVGLTSSNVYGQGDENFDTLRGHSDSGSAARFFYCAKANKKDRNEGLDGFAEKREADRIISDGVGGDNPRNRSNTPKLNHHPTVKPTELMRYLCRLVTPPNGTVLDPFTGSGSTGKAATLEGFTFIGIEQSAEYAEIANARINHAKENK
jgi:DNA modification methylase